MEKAFVDFFVVPVDFFVALEPGKVSVDAAFVCELTVFIGTTCTAPILDLPVCAMGLDYQILDDSFHK